MDRREFLKSLGLAAAGAAVAPQALAEAFKGGPTGFQAPTNLKGPVGQGFVVLEPGMSVQEAIDVLPADGGTVYIQEETYIVNQSITIPDDVTLMAQGNLTIEGCHIRVEARKRGDAPIWLLMEENDQVTIIGNRFDCEWGPMDRWFYAPIGEELERVKESIFRLFLKFKKLIV